VTYTIISSNVTPGIKRSLDVRLSRKVEEDVLRAIAINLEKADPRRYERTFIVYYLPEMEVGGGGWATTHFTPDLEVRIYGLTAGEESALVGEAADIKGESVGYWLDQRPMVAGTITIYGSDGKFYMERRFKDGSSIKHMLQRGPSNGNRYDKIGDSRFEAHYIIDRQGNLQIRDREGLIATARRIESTNPEK
jgi:hypothetical protein